MVCTGASVLRRVTVGGLAEYLGLTVANLTTRTPHVDRLADFEGNGVYYAATPLEAAVCAHAPAVVVGGGNSAGQAAMFLADDDCSVALVIRSGDLSKVSFSPIWSSPTPTSMRAGQVLVVARSRSRRVGLDCSRLAI